MPKPFSSTPMHVTLADDIENVPYAIAIGHTKPDGSPSPLSIFMTFPQAADIHQQLEELLDKQGAWPMPCCAHGIPYDDPEICPGCEMK